MSITDMIIPYGEPSKRLWWKSEQPGRDAIAIAQSIESSSDHQSRRRMSLRHLKLYANRDLQSIYDCGVAVRTYDAGVYLTMNVIQSCVDTVAAKLWKTPRIQCSTQAGDWSLKQRAKKLTRFADGLWYLNRWAGESRQVGAEATLFGSGVVQVYGDDTKDDEGDVVIERVLPDELIYDETEAIQGLRSLRTLYRKRFVHRQLLLEQWVDKAKGKDLKERRRLAIVRAAGADPREYSLSAIADMVPVYEAWHLPTTKASEDGYHLIAIPGQDDEAATLFDSERDGAPWTRRNFPMAFLPWTRLPTGLIGRSLAEELVPIQIRLNELLECIDTGQRLMCVPKVFYKANTINIDTWTNAFGELIEVTGDPQQAVRYEAGKGVSVELYNERDFWWKHSFEVTGISMLSATAAKPEGISSAVALRELLDREDMRLNPKGKQWEEFHCDVFERCVEAADDLAERNRKVIVQVPGRRDTFHSIQWDGKKGVNMERDKYMLRADAVNALPSTPMGRKQFAVEMWQLGAIDRARFFQLLEMPDTGSAADLITSAIELTGKAIEIMVEDDRYEAPDAYGDLRVAQTLAIQSYLQEKMDDAPEPVLLRLSRFIDECAEMIASNDNAQGQQQQLQTQLQAAPGTEVAQPGQAAA